MQNKYNIGDEEYELTRRKVAEFRAMEERALRG